MRASRTIRERLAQKAHPKSTLRAAECIEITESGVTLDGTPLPYFVGTEIAVDHFAADTHLVTFGVYADKVSIPPVLSARTTLTHRYH